MQKEFCETVGQPRLPATFPVHTAGPDWDIIKLFREQRHRGQSQRAQKRDYWPAVTSQGSKPSQHKTLLAEALHETETSELSSKQRSTQPAPQITWDPGPADRSTLRL